MLRPTRFGVKSTLFYGALCCAFFVAPYLNLFFLLLVFMTVFGLWGVLCSLRNMHGVTGNVAEIMPVPAGSRGPFRVEITGPRTIQTLLVDLQVDGTWYHRLAYASQIERRGSIEGQLPPLSRGIHSLTCAQVHSNHPFGTQRSLRRIDHPDEIVVFPQPSNLGQWRDRTHLLSSLGVPCHELSAEREPTGLRGYRQGDELRHVHWRASARRTGLVVREFESDAAPGLCIQLDLRCDQDALEHALSLVAALAIDASERKEVLTLTSQGHHRSYGPGHGSLADLWRFLALAQPLPASAQAPASVSRGTLRLPASARTRANAVGVR